LSATLNAPFLAFAAGAILFVAVHELAPLARLYEHSGVFLLGAMLSAATYVLLALLSVGRVGGFAP
jgi:ZIP family zinc transporter